MARARRHACHAALDFFSLLLVRLPGTPVLAVRALDGSRHLGVVELRAVRPVRIPSTGDDLQFPAASASLDGVPAARDGAAAGTLDGRPSVEAFDHSCGLLKLQGDGVPLDAGVEGDAR